MLKGIDTSHYSVFGLTELQKTSKTNNLYFNYIKASEGTTLKDTAFVTNWNNSRESGLLCGAYHFFRPLAGVDDQVSNFLSQYKLVSRTGVLPPVIDIEWATANNTIEQWGQLNIHDRIPKIKAMLSGLENATKIKPVIYTATAFWKEFIEAVQTEADKTFFSGYKLWIVDLKKTSTIPSVWKNTGAAFTQYHFGENATTSDHYDKTDQNTFNGSLRELLNLTASGFTLMKGFPVSNIVRDIQAILISGNFLQDKADGIFGSNTEKAVKDFQRKNNFFDNGIVDAQTWNILLK